MLLFLVVTFAVTLLCFFQLEWIWLRKKRRSHDEAKNPSHSEATTQPGVAKKQRSQEAAFRSLNLSCPYYFHTISILFPMDAAIEPWIHHCYLHGRLQEIIPAHIAGSCTFQVRCVGPKPPGCQMQPMEVVSTVDSESVTSRTRCRPRKVPSTFFPPVLAAGMVGAMPGSSCAWMCMYPATFLLNPSMAAGCCTITIIKTSASMALRCPVIFGPVRQRWTPWYIRVLQLCQAFGGRCQHWEGGEYARPISTLSLPEGRCLQQFLAEELCCECRFSGAEPGIGAEGAAPSLKKRKTTACRSVAKKPRNYKSHTG